MRAGASEPDGLEAGAIGWVVTVEWTLCPEAGAIGWVVTVESTLGLEAGAIGWVVTVEGTLGLEAGAIGWVVTVEWTLGLEAGAIGAVGRVHSLYVRPGERRYLIYRHGFAVLQAPWDSLNTIEHCTR